MHKSTSVSIEGCIKPYKNKIPLVIQIVIYMCLVFQTIGSCILGSWTRKEGQVWRNSKSVKRIKRTAYRPLSFTSHLMPPQVILRTVRERMFSGRSEEVDRPLLFAKGICLRWACGRQSVFKPRHKRDPICFHNSFPPSSYFYAKVCANYSSIWDVIHHYSIQLLLSFVPFTKE